MKSRPIGLTDSGIGGLSILRSALGLLPSERFVYLADSAFMPYGDKPSEVVVNRVMDIHRYLQSLDCKATVLACNTATAAAADALRSAYPGFPIVGIEPAVKPAAMITKTGVVGILATANTLASNRFQALVSRFDSVATVHALPCPGLVELIEKCPRPLKDIDDLLFQRLSTMLNLGVDVIVLGCTHYPFVADRIQAIVGPQVQIIETGIPVARQLRARLEAIDALAAPTELQSSPAIPARRVQCYTTGDAQAFFTQMLDLMGPEWGDVSVRQIDLEALPN